MSYVRDRAAERVLVEAFVKVHGADGRQHLFRTRDLSEQGLFLATKVAHVYPFKVGSTLQLELYDADQHIACTVVVVRIVEPGTAESDAFPAGFGLRIVECSEASRRALAAMIQRIKAGKAY